MSLACNFDLTYSPLPSPQNPEPAVEFDTVANKKQQHEVNIGK